MVVAILIGHAPVKGCLRTMGIHLADSAGWRLKQCSTSYAVVSHWLVSVTVFWGELFVKPKEISTASVRDLCLSIRETGLLNLW